METEIPDGPNRTTALRIVKIVSACLVAAVFLSIFTAGAGFVLFQLDYVVYMRGYFVGNLLATFIIAEIHRAWRDGSPIAFKPACVGIAFTFTTACLFSANFYHEDIVGMFAPFFGAAMVGMSIPLWLLTSWWLSTVVRRAYA